MADNPDDFFQRYMSNRNRLENGRIDDQTANQELEYRTENLPELEDDDEVKNSGSDGSGWAWLHGSDSKHDGGEGYYDDEEEEEQADIEEEEDAGVIRKRISSNQRIIESDAESEYPGDLGLGFSLSGDEYGQSPSPQYEDPEGSNHPSPQYEESDGSSNHPSPQYEESDGSSNHPASPPISSSNSSSNSSGSLYSAPSNLTPPPSVHSDSSGPVAKRLRSKMQSDTSTSSSDTPSSDSQHSSIPDSKSVSDPSSDEDVPIRPERKGRKRKRNKKKKKKCFMVCYKEDEKIPGTVRRRIVNKRDRRYFSEFDSDDEDAPIISLRPRPGYVDKKIFTLTSRGRCNEDPNKTFYALTKLDNGLVKAKSIYCKNNRWTKSDGTLYNGYVYDFVD